MYAGIPRLGNNSLAHGWYRHVLNFMLFIKPEKAELLSETLASHAGVFRGARISSLGNSGAIDVNQRFLVSESHFC